MLLIFLVFALIFRSTYSVTGFCPTTGRTGPKRCAFCIQNGNDRGRTPASRVFYPSSGGFDIIYNYWFITILGNISPKCYGSAAATGRGSHIWDGKQNIGFEFIRTPSYTFGAVGPQNERCYVDLCTEDNSMGTCKRYYAGIVYRR